MLIIFGYRLQPCYSLQCIEAVTDRMAPLLGLRLLLGYHNYYTIHGSPYRSAHVLFENTLGQHKMAKNSCMTCCQNRLSKCTNQCYASISLTSISACSALLNYGARLTEEEEEELVQNGIFSAVFRLATQNTLTVVINGLDRSEHAPVCCLATYFYV